MSPAFYPFSSRQGEAVPGSIIEGPSAWRAADYATNENYVLQLSKSDIAELDAALAHIAKLGVDIKDVTLADVSLPTLGPKLLDVAEDVKNGRGFALLRGVPVLRYSRWESVAAYWIIGLHWGTALPNNKKGHLVGHIKDIGHDPTDPVTRLYATSAAQPWHCDNADLVSLLCLRTAHSGGESSWSSSIAVYNEIVRRRPDLAELLAGPDWYYDRKDEIPKGKLPYFRIPVFNFHKGYLSVNFSSNYFILSQRHADVPRLTAAHHEAIALFEELAGSPELAIHYVLQPGEVQLLNNHVCLHMRKAFVNGPTEDEQRHLLRLWLAPAVDRPLSDDYAELYAGSVEPGRRGGILIDGAQEVIALEAE